MNTEANDELYVCPDCGSSMVEFSSLAGGMAKCGVCKWEGTREALLAVPFQNNMGAPAEVIVAIRNDLRKIIGQMATPLLTFLIKWGFVEAVQQNKKVKVTNPAMVVRYMNAISTGLFSSILAERAKIEKERFDGN
jgi:ribosomal protein L37AE/L43A